MIGLGRESEKPSTACTTAARGRGRPQIGVQARPPAAGSPRGQRPAGRARVVQGKVLGQSARTRAAGAGPGEPVGGRGWGSRLAPGLWGGRCWDEVRAGIRPAGPPGPRVFLKLTGFEVPSACLRWFAVGSAVQVRVRCEVRVRLGAVRVPGRKGSEGRTEMERHGTGTASSAGGGADPSSRPHAARRPGPTGRAGLGGRLLAAPVTRVLAARGGTPRNRRAAYAGRWWTRGCRSSLARPVQAGRRIRRPRGCYGCRGARKRSAGGGPDSPSRPAYITAMSPRSRPAAGEVVALMNSTARKRSRSRRDGSSSGSPVGHHIEARWSGSSGSRLSSSARAIAIRPRWRIAAGQLMGESCRAVRVDNHHGEKNAAGAGLAGGPAQVRLVRLENV